MACKNFRLSENKNLEIQLDNFKVGLSAVIGWYINLSTRGFGAKIGLILLQVEIDLRWKGDHTGAEFRMNFYEGTMFSINFYDSRHEEDYIDVKK